MRTTDYAHAQWMDDNFDATPAIRFPATWLVRVRPSAGGALTRFTVNDRVSVYFDIDGSLGAVNQPYWEIYPDAGGDDARFLVGEEQLMLDAIQSSLDVRDT